MISRIIVGLCAIGHLLIGLGIGWGIGPVEYDPEAFFVRSTMVGKLEPGLETLFPRLLGCLYASLAMGLFYALIIVTTAGRDETNQHHQVLRVSLVPCIFYHFGAATDAMNLFREDAGAINPDKLDPNEPAIGHCFFLVLSIVAFVLAAGTKSSATRAKETAENVHSSSRFPDKMDAPMEDANDSSPVENKLA
ncbi:expressed unknown protein [Seminavis robusta]|uniref:Uncharacterized protein n=1 Tax=Seminavis robusta TaxID=568900 RepID=A0A9N8HPI8_9STRA|nr:expressed unknown protein [Seminavis robusta]|eukprot:Sro1072_g238110.1 n/a (193) ;mRNA; r:26298-27113